MSKLTFGIEMELFIKLDKNLYTLIYNEIITNNCHTIQELLNHIYTQIKRVNPFSYVYDTAFSKNVNSQQFTNTKLTANDTYVIILIISHIICKNNHYHSFSLFDKLRNDDTNPLILPNCKSKINWFYDEDTSLAVKHSNYSNIYKTIKKLLKGKLIPDNHVPYTEFVSSVFSNSEQVKIGVDLLLNSLQKKLKLTPFHAIQTSNHIHFSIKDKKLGITNPYIIFQITYVFYILQNFIYLICLPNRRTSHYCRPLQTLDSSIKSLDDLTINEFFNIPISFETSSYTDTKQYLTIEEQLRIEELLESQNQQLRSLLETPKQLIKKIDTIQRKIDKLSKINPEDYVSSPSNSPRTFCIPYKNLLFKDKLILLMHIYQNKANYRFSHLHNKNSYIIDPCQYVNRYSILNLYKLSTGDSCTLELRAKHGSNDSTEIKYFCDLIEKFYEIALQLDKDKPLLESLTEILNLNDLISFKNIDPKDLKSQYSTLKTTFLPKLLHSIFKDDLKSINYWLKHLDIVNNLDLL